MSLDGRSRILVASFERETSRRGEKPACYRPLVAFLTMARYLGVEASFAVYEDPLATLLTLQGTRGQQVLRRG
jgi:hypothetical protein